MLALGVVTAPTADADTTDEFSGALMLQSKTMLCVAWSNRKLNGQVWEPDERVACQSSFAQVPPQYNSVGLSADGKLTWFTANLPTPQYTTYLPMLPGQTLTWGNWSIYHYPDETGTRFTNTRTGHGMYASRGNVYAF